MESVKFDRVVSVNSEIEGHGARNLIDEEIRPNKNWMCEKGTEKAVVILQLDKPTVFASIDIGNAHSAFVEILVGKAADTDQHFESLLPMSILMKPQECKSGENKNQTRFFGKADFNEAISAKAWDRIKGMKQDQKVDLPTRNDEEGNIEIGSFFKKKNDPEKNKPLTVSEQIKQVEKEALLTPQTPVSITKMNTKLGDKLPWGKKEEKQNTEKMLNIKMPKRKKDDDKVPERRQEEENTFEKGKTKVLENICESKKPFKRKSPEKDDDCMTKKRKKEKTVRPKKSFQKLMDDVVLVISGFKNPLRGDIRNMAFQMGARYSADWDSHCTHLVCAYENTPKFNQVKGKGKIVKKDWVEKCHKDKKRYPWRRFALDQNDFKKPESEEEVDGTEEAELEEVEVPTSSKAGTFQNKEKAGDSSQKTSLSDECDLAIDEDEKNNVEVETTDYPMPFLPDIFHGKTFFVDPNVKIKKELERYIIAHNGTVMETFNEVVEFYVTEKGGAPVELLRKKVPNLVAIKPSWIWEVRSKLECVPTTPHLVK